MKLKRYQKILLVAVIVIIGLGIMKNFLIRTAITTVGSNVVGAPIRIKHFSLGFLTQKVHIKGMTVGNPKGFPKENLVDIPEIRVHYDLKSLLGGKIYLPLAKLDLKQVVLVKDKDGNLNVDALKIAQTPEQQDPKKDEPAAEKDGGKELAIQIDELHLNIERVVVKDFSQGEKAVVTAYETPLQDKVFKNIKSPEQLATLVMVQAMGPTAIQGAKIYGAAAVLGAAFLPAGAVGILVGKDHSLAEYKASYDEVYDVSLKALESVGEIKTGDPATGVIKAKVNGGDIAVKLEETSEKKIQVTISARKMMLPKPEIAGGIQYLIEQEL